MATLTRRRLVVREVPGMAQLPAHWRGACVILAAGFPNDDDVWDRVAPGQVADLTPLCRDLARPLADRVLLACAQSLTDGTAVVPFRELANLDDRRLTLVLDALAIARGSFPID